MNFWLPAILLLLLALWACLRPLLRSDARTIDNSAFDTNVYKSQLDEIDRDVSRGQITDSEAEMARTEIARRLIAANDKSNSQSGIVVTSHTTVPNLKAVAVATALVVSAASLSGYYFLGANSLPDNPLSARLKNDPAGQSLDNLSINEVIARAEAHISKNPNDGRGWLALAPVYLQLGRTRDAINAYRNTIRLNGETPALLAILGEAITIETGGLVTQEAKLLFEKAAVGDPTDIKPKFFLALALRQEGKFEEAVEAWESVIAASPNDAVWLPTAKEQLAIAQNQSSNIVSNTDDKAPAPGNPTEEDVENAAQLGAEDRREMIETMVASLAEKLDESPNNLEGWLRLIRSYKVLGKEPLAIQAYEKATAQFQSENDAIAKLKSLATNLELKVEN